jgi:hypothetical protein
VLCDECGTETFWQIHEDAASSRNRFQMIKEKRETDRCMVATTPALQTVWLAPLPNVDDRKGFVDYLLWFRHWRVQFAPKINFSFFF